MRFLVVVVIATMASVAMSFSNSPRASMRANSIKMQINNEDAQSDRQIAQNGVQAFGSKFMSAAAIALATTSAVGVQPAYAARIDDMNNKLAGYG